MANFSSNNFIQFSRWKNKTFLWLTIPFKKFTFLQLRLQTAQKRCWARNLNFKRELWKSTWRGDKCTCFVQQTFSILHEPFTVITYSMDQIDRCIYWGRRYFVHILFELISSLIIMESIPGIPENRLPKFAHWMSIES